VGADIATGVGTLICFACSVALARLFLRKTGNMPIRETPTAVRGRATAVPDKPAADWASPAAKPRRRGLFWAVMTTSVATTGFLVWAFSTNHAAIGVAGVIVFLVLPQLVLTGLRLRRSRPGS
jgi:cobalamin biosynthesis protein CobD/CbiB